MRKLLEYIWGGSLGALIILAVVYAGTYLVQYANFMLWMLLVLAIVVTIGTLVSYIERRSYIEGFHEAEEKFRKDSQP